MKKLVSAALALILSVSAVSLVGCRNIGEEVISGGDGSGGELVIGCMDAGFGLEWLNNIAKSFAAENNVNITVGQLSGASEVISQMAAGKCNYDIIMTVGSLFKSSQQGYLENLTEKVYAQTPEGESETIAAKMNQGVYEGMKNAEGQLYMMTWADAVAGIAYNKTTLDEIYPDGWEIPNTTDELLALCTDIKNIKQEDGAQKYYPFSGTAKSDYSDYLIMAWGAQYDGTEAYFDYYDLLYTDANGEKQVAQSYADIAPEGRLEALTVLETMNSQSKGYMHAYATEMDYLEAQSAFAGNGFGSVDTRKCAFIVSGAWLENELATDLAMNPQEIGMMKTPVISSIIDKTRTILDDEMLSKVIDQIDAGKSWEEALAADATLKNVSEEDYERIAQARNCIYSGVFDHCVGVPVNGANDANKQNAYDFLVYMASDKGQEIYAETLDGLTQTYGYDADVSESGYFVQSVVNGIGKDYTPIYTDYSSACVTDGGLRYLAMNDRTSGLMNGSYRAATLNSRINQYWEDLFSVIKGYLVD